MCLACEMDALWFAEMEELAHATPPGSAGVPPALESSSASAALGTFEGAGETPALQDSSTCPMSNSFERAGGTPAVPGSPFLCEETRSE
jgi:hypothetical protein